tara:strand:+ start:482 stop:745 length:264 start_codon:yes stop_codon:yes gene_type:complete
MSFDKLSAIDTNTRFTRNNTKLSDHQKLVNQANDLVTNFTYLDASSSTDRRVSTIVYSSSSLNITATETFTYSGSSGNYYVTQIQLS